MPRVGTTGASTSGVMAQRNWTVAAPPASQTIPAVQHTIVPTSVSIPAQQGTQVAQRAPAVGTTVQVQSTTQSTHGTHLQVAAPQTVMQVQNTTTPAAQGNQLQSPPNIQATPQVQGTSAPLASAAPSQGHAVQGQGTIGGGGAPGSKTIILPTNLKVNCNNKQWKLVYVQKPGAPKPELCLQPCTADGSSQIIPLPQPQQQLQATNAGRNLSIQLVPQGNKIVMQAVGTPTRMQTPQDGTPTRVQTPQNIMVQTPQVGTQTRVQTPHNIMVQTPQVGTQTRVQTPQNIMVQTPQVGTQTRVQTPHNIMVQTPQVGTQTRVQTPQNIMVQTPQVGTPSRVQTPQNIIMQNSQGATQIVNVGVGNQGRAVPMMTTPVMQVAPTMHTGANKVPIMSPAGNHNAVFTAGATTMVANQNAVAFSSGFGNTMITSSSFPSNNVIFQAASASGLVAPGRSGLVMQAPQQAVSRISIQHAPQNSGQ